MKKIIFITIFSILGTINVLAQNNEFVNRGGINTYEVTQKQHKIPDYSVQYPVPELNELPFLGMHVVNSRTECNSSFLYMQNQNVNLRIYYPKLKDNNSGLENNKCPVVVFGYGGGFLHPYSGPVGAGDLMLEQQLAAQGFIVVVPEYRIGFDLYDSELNCRSIWRAVQDLRKTIRYCRDGGINSLFPNDFRIDTTKKISYIGYSSGAVMGLYNLYLNDDFEGGSNPKGTRPKKTSIQQVQYLNRSILGYDKVVNGATYELGELDNPTGVTHVTYDAEGKQKGVQDLTISISGAIKNLDMINKKISSPLLLIQHPEDAVVPYDTGYAYKGFYLYKSNRYQYPYLHGSKAIDRYFEQNSSYKPDIFKFITVQEDCNNMPNCIQGDAGTNSGPLGIPSWHHSPLFKGHVGIANPFPNTIPLFNNTPNFEVVSYIKNFINDNVYPQPRRILNKSATPDANTIKNIDGKEITIYPNPVSGDIMNITAIDQGTPYAIYNMLGQQVGSGKVENGTIAVANLSQGTYILKVSTKDQDVVKQFIKQ